MPIKNIFERLFGNRTNIDAQKVVEAINLLDAKLNMPLESDTIEEIAEDLSEIRKTNLSNNIATKLNQVENKLKNAVINEIKIRFESLCNMPEDQQTALTGWINHECRKISESTDCKKMSKKTLEIREIMKSWSLHWTIQSAPVRNESEMKEIIEEVKQPLKNIATFLKKYKYTFSQEFDNILKLGYHKLIDNEKCLIDKIKIYYKNLFNYNAPLKTNQEIDNAIGQLKKFLANAHNSQLHDVTKNYVNFMIDMLECKKYYIESYNEQKVECDDSKFGVTDKNNFTKSELPMWKTTNSNKPLISTDDLHQTYATGDCWLISTLLSLAQNKPELILNCFPNRNEEIGLDGKLKSDKITVRLYRVYVTARPKMINNVSLIHVYARAASPVDITMSATVPSTGGNRRNDTKTKVLWPSFIEKAVSIYRLKNMVKIKIQDYLQDTSILSAKLDIERHWSNKKITENNILEPIYASTNDGIAFAVITGKSSSGRPFRMAKNQNEAITKAQTSWNIINILGQKGYNINKGWDLLCTNNFSPQFYMMKPTVNLKPTFYKNQTYRVNKIDPPCSAHPSDAYVTLSDPYFGFGCGYKGFVTIDLLDLSKISSIFRNLTNAPYSEHVLAYANNQTQQQICNYIAKKLQKHRNLTVGFKKFEGRTSLSLNHPTTNKPYTLWSGHMYSVMKVKSGYIWVRDPQRGTAGGPDPNLGLVPVPIDIFCKYCEGIDWTNMK